jgi:hypothetical protein
METPRRGAGRWKYGYGEDQCFLVFVSVFVVVPVVLVPPVDVAPVVVVVPVDVVAVVSVDIVPVVPVIEVSVDIVELVLLLTVDDESVATAPVSVTLLLFVSLLQA